MYATIFQLKITYDPINWNVVLKLSRRYSYTKIHTDLSLVSIIKKIDKFLFLLLICLDSFFTVLSNI